MSSSPAVAQTRENLPVYDLDLSLDLGAGRLTGRARITLTRSAVADGHARFAVAGNGVVMEVDGVHALDGTALEFDAPDTDGHIDVRLARSDTSARVVIDYHRSVDTSQLEPFGYWAFAPFGPSTWAYPEIVLPDGEPPPFSDFDVTLASPASLAVLTTGGQGELAPGEATPGASSPVVHTHYRSDHVEGFAIVAGEGFRVSRYQDAGVPVVAFYHPDYAEPFAQVIEATKEAAAWYQRTYGFFPLGEVGVIQGHPRWGGGYPLPNLYAFHLGNLDPNHITWITAHELGHYYWGLHVLGDKERLDWLQLALGIWSDQLYLAEKNGVTLPEQWRSPKRQGDWFAEYLEAQVAGYQQRMGITSQQEQDLDFDYNSLIRHAKAATALYLESMQLGPERFLELQRRILAGYRHRPLPEADFVSMLVDAGLDGAPAFFAAWKLDNSRIDAKVTEVGYDEATGGWNVGLFRTGSVPYPVPVEVLTAGGQKVRYVIAADVNADTVVVRSKPVAVQLDPDGEIPMWNSAHPGIRSAFARALERAGQDGTFVPLARDVLAEAPNEAYLRYRLTRRLYWIGRWEESARLWQPGVSCDSYYDCLAGLYAARASARAGDQDRAEAMIDALRAGAKQNGAEDLFETVFGEVLAGRHLPQRKPERTDGLTTLRTKENVEIADPAQVTRVDPVDPVDPLYLARYC